MKHLKKEISHIYLNQNRDFLPTNIEENILKQVLQIHGPIKAEKYIQEIFWRTYWKGWLEHRPGVYTDYIIEKNNL